eukprot:CAMPEP_0194283154 /NCGR_PEP_ID=MMETSP0169-20130528/24770_1 /TAXON_ID=218684 /ORGANISM="Corethron pennatum, Strain L29A3" /LENGTH=82 /DNA_ID=CAMNT_0039028693 /DNA_START=46 /DNA_END=290 /DNA_ORIENTATION=-
MGRFKSDDFGYGFAASSKTTIGDGETDRDERTPLTADIIGGKEHANGGDKYSLYEETTSPQQRGNTHAPAAPLAPSASAAYR